jgi:anti-sigma regulatory factor (Ser/Thr protein kinase)
MTNPSELRVREKAQPQSARLLRHALDAFLTAHDIDADTRIDIITAVGEALANSIEHAYAPNNIGDVELRARITDVEPRIAVDIIDGGRFVPRARRPFRGFGLRIIKSAARTVRIDTRAGTAIRLEFDSARA